MQITVNNFRKIETAEVEVETLTVVGGFNEAGKTTLAQAAGLCLTGEHMLFGLPKKDAKKLVRNGAKGAAVSIAGEQGSCSISYPAAEVKSKGHPPRASRIAVGFDKLTHMPKRDAAMYVAETLNAFPNKEDLDAVLVPIMGEEYAENTWSTIIQQGWEAAHSHVMEEGRMLKAEWKTVTGDTYGVRKAEVWSPESFTPDMEVCSIEDLEKAVQTEQQLLEEAIAANAVTESHIQSLRQQVEQLPSLKKRYDELGDVLKGLQAQEQGLRDEISTIEIVRQSGSEMTCPECGSTICLNLSDGTPVLEKIAEDDGKAETEEQKLEVLRTELNDVLGKISKSSSEYAEVKQKGQAAKRAKEEVDSLPEDSGSGSDSVVQQHRGRVDVATRRLSDFRSWKRAEEIHQKILKIVEVAKELAPEGLRQRKMGEALEDFNTSRLLPLCEKFGIRPVSIDLNMDVFLGTDVYMLLSESAKFRVDCVLQVAFAGLDGSEMVIIDGADIIVGKDRGGLAAMLLSSPIPALLCMSLSKPSSIPNLSKVGGKAYWMESSVAQEVEQ